MTKRETALLAMTLAAVACMYTLLLSERPAALTSLPAEEAEAPAETALLLRWGGSVDLNSAGAEELTVLPGVGETLAGRIVAWREENGPFTSLEDLLNVEGVGESTVLRLYEMMEEP